MGGYTEVLWAVEQISVELFRIWFDLVSLATAKMWDLWVGAKLLTFFSSFMGAKEGIGTLRFLYFDFLTLIGGWITRFIHTPPYLLSSGPRPLNFRTF